MDLEQLTNEVRAIQIEQLMDAAIIGVLLRTHPNPALLRSAWEKVGFEADDMQGEDARAFRNRFDHWMEMIVDAEKGGD